MQGIVQTIGSPLWQLDRVVMDSDDLPCKKKVSQKSGHSKYSRFNRSFTTFGIQKGAFGLKTHTMRPRNSGGDRTIVVKNEDVAVVR